MTAIEDVLKGVLFTDIPSLTIPATVNAIQTSGRTSVGLYPALYIRDPDQSAYTTGGQSWIVGASNTAAAQAAVLSILDRIRIQDAEDNWWVIDDDNQEVHGGHFGMVPDGAFNETTNAMTGTDNSAALQALIDWRLYLTIYSRHVKPIDIPAGIFRLASVVQLGYSAYFSACIRGTNSPFANGMGGTTLLLDVANNPGLALNTVATGSVEDITFYGKLLSYLNEEGFCLLETPELDDRLLANWFPSGTPALDPRLRYNPLCAIALDPYAGPAPGTAYNPPLPPAWQPDSVRIGYGKVVGCTKVCFRRCTFWGFPVGVVVQPCDADGNGDFTSFEDCCFSRTAVAVSVGNTQSRAVGLLRCQTNICHTAVTTAMHGRQNGRLQGTIVDCSFSAAIQAFDLSNGMAIAGPIVCSNLYMEQAYRIGVIANSSAATGSIVFLGGCFDFHLQSDAEGGRGVPTYVIGQETNVGYGGNAIVRFVGAHFNNYSTVLTVLQENSSFQDVSVQGAWAEAMTSSKTYWPAWKRAAMDMLAGGVVLARLARGKGEQRIRHVFWGAAAGETPIDTATCDQYPTSRTYTASLYSRSLSPSAGLMPEAIPNLLAAPLDKSSFTSTSLSGRIYQFSYSRPGWALEDYDQIRIGSVLYDLNTGFVFFVKAITGSDPNWTIQAELQNGFRIASGGSVTLERSFSASSGLMRAVAPGLFTPLFPTLFDTNSSTTLTNVKRGDGYGGYIDNTGASEVQSGDVIKVNAYLDNWSGFAKVTGFPAANQLSISNSAVDTKAGRRMALVRRKPPAAADA